MKPPHTIEDVVYDGGFTALILPKEGTLDHEIYGTEYTLWRPARLLKSRSGELVIYDENSFYQTNDNVTKATYKVKYYPHYVVCWFDNASGERIA